MQVDWTKVTKEQRVSIDKLVEKGFVVNIAMTFDHTLRIMVHLFRGNLKNAEYAEVAPNGDINGTFYQTFLDRL